MNELASSIENKRSWHPSFIKYTEFIVSAPNYKGLLFERNSEELVKWVITGKSEKGQERRKWWDNQCKKSGIKIEAGCYAKIALKIHPTKRHTCQICGKELSLEYVYPNRRTIIALEKEFDISVAPFSKNIFQIITELVKNTDDIEKIKRIFKIQQTEKLTKVTLGDYIKRNYVDNFAKGSLSPGAMSNSPDRFDGFHSDGACCRHESDKGRHKTNLQRYGQDRRVYENWADGDWKMADRLMSYFRKHGLSADHIGPISLGFAHRPKFHPLTKEENSAKNNRMSFNDVQVLITDEANGETVISWHSAFIWNKLKGKVKNDKDAVKLSDLMRKNIHYILIIFSMIDENEYSAFLEQFLNPEHSFFDYSFEGFDPKTGYYKSFNQIKRSGKNQQNNITRYYRVAFEKLQEYRLIDNRKNNKLKNENVDNELNILFTYLKANRNDDAKIQLDKILNLLTDLAERNW
ncbi:MAG: restriction endonuclease [Methylococcaceae bacterium]|nr:restriction endonuclease [Methylococcaceae bacterium]